MNLRQALGCYILSFVVEYLYSVETDKEAVAPATMKDEFEDESFWKGRRIVLKTLSFRQFYGLSYDFNLLRRLLHSLIIILSAGPMKILKSCFEELILLLLFSLDSAQPILFIDLLQDIGILRKEYILTVFVSIFRGALTLLYLSTEDIVIIQLDMAFLHSNIAVNSMSIVVPDPESSKLNTRFEKERDYYLFALLNFDLGFLIRCQQLILE